jgi:hypothetical protein
MCASTDDEARGVRTRRVVPVSPVGARSGPRTGKNLVHHLWTGVAVQLIGWSLLITPAT